MQKDKGLGFVTVKG